MKQQAGEQVPAVLVKVVVRNQLDKQRDAIHAYLVVKKGELFFFKGKENFTDMLKMLKRGKPKPSKTQA